MSETPRTDAAAFFASAYLGSVVTAETARELEVVGLTWAGNNLWAWGGRRP